jgi:hypothetical protein
MCKIPRNYEKIPEVLYFGDMELKYHRILKFFRKNQLENSSPGEFPESVCRLFIVQPENCRFFVC